MVDQVFDPVDQRFDKEVRLLEAESEVQLEEGGGWGGRT
jgi:hypothetical protein